METAMETPGADSWLSAPCLAGAPQERQETETPTQAATYASLKPPCPSMPLETARDVIGLREQKEIVQKPLRPHSTPATLMWLEENYEIADGVCIPRSTLYMHYVDFCGRNGMQPVNAASFGKIIRQQFPQLTTRRLGTRGQSRYHYYGIAVRETSPYYEVNFSKKGSSNTLENATTQNVKGIMRMLENFLVAQQGGDTKKEVIKQSSLYCQRSKVGTLLPEFPSVRDLRLPSSVPEEKVATFVMMYRTHCQRVLDSIIRASFDEVQSFLLHFWQGMPSHITAVLGSNVIVNIVGVCDSILYRAISNVLLPTVVQPMPESLTQVVRKFAKDMESWVRMALEDLPQNLMAVKSDLARRFSQTLRRQTSLSHMSQTTRMILHNSDITGQMLQDWRNIDLDGISRQTLYTMDQAYNCITLELVTNLYREFESLLEEQSPIESYIDWLETMVDRCVVQPSRKRKLSLSRLARQFLLMWTSFGTRIMRDMTLHSAPSFGSYHLVRLMLDDYVLYLVETLHAEERMRELFANISADAPPVFPEVDDTFSDPDANMNKIKWYNSPATNPPEAVLAASSMIITTSAQSTESGVITQASPSQEVPDSNGMREGCIMGEDNTVTSASPSSEGQMVHDYTTGNEHYSSMYSYSGTYDGRNGFRPGNNGTLARQESRTYAYPANQYVMAQHNSTEGGHVDLSVARVNSARVTPEGATVSGVDYSNSYVAYTTAPRRSDYGNYVYDQGSSPLLYPAGNCYYQAYEAPAVPATAYYNNRYKSKEEESSSKRRPEEGMDEDKVTSTEGTPMTTYAIVAATNTYVRV